jgi:hypothetical protein
MDVHPHEHVVRESSESNDKPVVLRYPDLVLHDHDRTDPGSRFLIRVELGEKGQPREGRDIDICDRVGVMFACGPDEQAA